MAIVSKIDYFDLQRSLYSTKPGKFVLVDVPEMNFFAINGAGNPNTSKDFGDAIVTLYRVAYTLKFAWKLGPKAVDFKVMPLESLWWMQDLSVFDPTVKDKWLWRVMLRVPDIVTAADLIETLLTLHQRKKDPPAGSRLQLMRFTEELCAQTMYIGAYAGEGPTIVALHEFIKEQDHTLRGRHHEIYLSDPERTAPQNLKTIIRQPVA